MATDFMMSIGSIFIYAILIAAVATIYVNTIEESKPIMCYKSIEGLTSCIRNANNGEICVGNAHSLISLIRYGNTTVMRCVDTGYSVIVNESIGGEAQIIGEYTCKEGKDGAVCYGVEEK